MDTLPEPEITTSMSHAKLYEPLDQTKRSIRLIQLAQTLSQEGYIVCTLAHWTIESDYHALSYTWGSEDSTNPILLNGREVIARENLWDFLNCERESEPSRSLWIDALCIDQANVAERNHQVQQMSQIYRNARQVIVWLINEHPKKLSPVVILRKIQTQYSTTSLERLWNYGSLDALVCNSYWKRIWIIQEVSLASQLLFKDRVTELTMERDQLLQFMGELFEPRTTPFEFRTTHLAPNPFGENSKGLQRKGLDGILRWLGGMGSRKVNNKLPISGSLTYFLRLFAESMCSDPRDRIYAALSIVRFGDEFKVDYNLDIPKTYLQTFRYFGEREIAGGGDLSALADALTQALFVDAVESQVSSFLAAYGTTPLQAGDEYLKQCRICHREFVSFIPDLPLLCMKDLKSRLYPQAEISGVDRVHLKIIPPLHYSKDYYAAFVCE